MATPRLLQANLNHCARAQDLLDQSLAQWSINVAVVAEPYFVPPGDAWVSDACCSVAIFSCAAAGTPSPAVVTKRRGVVATRFGADLVVAVYASPS